MGLQDRGVGRCFVMGGGTSKHMAAMAKMPPI